MFVSRTRYANRFSLHLHLDRWSPGWVHQLKIWSDYGSVPHLQLVVPQSNTWNVHGMWITSDLDWTDEGWLLDLVSWKILLMTGPILRWLRWAHCPEGPRVVDDRDFFRHPVQDIGRQPMVHVRWKTDCFTWRGGIKARHSEMLWGYLKWSFVVFLTQNFWHSDFPSGEAIGGTGTGVFKDWLVRVAANMETWNHVFTVSSWRSK